MNPITFQKEDHKLVPAFILFTLLFAVGLYAGTAFASMVSTSGGANVVALVSSK